MESGKCLQDAVKGLGLTLDRILSFDDHIVKVTGLCMSILGQNKRVNLELLTIVINALVFSKLFYCSSVWSSTSGKKYQETPIHPEFCRTYHQRPW